MNRWEETVACPNCGAENYTETWWETGRDPARHWTCPDCEAEHIDEHALDDFI